MTKSQNSYAGLTPFEVSNVRHRARCLALKPDLGLAVEDIEQELFAHILEKRACFDPERASWPTFVDRILLTKTIDMLVSARAAKRRSGPTTPLDSVELVDPLSLDIRATDIRIDLSRRAARLPHHQAELICALREKTMSEISRDSGVAKSTLYATRAAVQRELEPLQDYLR
jgi:hypothetical protein